MGFQRDHKMNFERGIEPVKSMNLGKNRILKKYDTFEVIFLEIPDSPEFKKEALALTDEEQVFYTTYSGLSGVSIQKEVRQVDFSVEDYIGRAENEGDGKWKVLHQ